MKKLIFCMLLLGASVLVYGQSEVANRLDFSPPLKGDFKIPIHTLTNDGDTLATVETFYTHLLKKGVKQRTYSNDSIILGMPIGITYEVEKGSPVFAAGNGKLVRITYDKHRKGAWVQVKHEKHLKSEYIALGDLKVRKGQQIKKGQLIGYTTFPAFHFQFRLKDEPIEPPSHFYQKDKMFTKAF